MSLAAITLVGHLGKDPEKRKDKNDNPFVTFSMAVSTGKDQTMWFDVMMFGRRAKTLAEHAKKGSLIGITGSVTPNTFKRNDGTEVQGITVTTENFTFIGGGKKSEGNNSGGGDNAASQQTEEDPW